MSKKVQERNNDLRKRIEDANMGAMKVSTKVAQVCDEVFGNGDIVFLGKLLELKGYRLVKEK
jgi:hypothetical protein